MKYKNFVLDGHPSKLKALAEFLKQHEIQSYSLEKKSSIKGYDYQKQKTTTTSFSENALVVPTRQVKGKMAQVLLEPQTKLSDSLTYDITAWSLPYAYGLKAVASKENVPTVTIKSESKEKSSLEVNAYGYAFPYKSFRDANF